MNRPTSEPDERGKRIIAIRKEMEMTQGLFGKMLKESAAFICNRETGRYSFEEQDMERFKKNASDFLLRRFIRDMNEIEGFR